MVHKLSISMTEELHSALVLTCLRRRMTMSRLIETLVREHPDLRKDLELVLAEPAGTNVLAVPGKGRKKRAGSRLKGRVSASA
jgi:hypothetical protein